MDDLRQYSDERACIKVIGVGGAGCNAVDSMFEEGIPGVQFVSINTDEQSLNKCGTDVRIQIGKVCTRGLGAGADPEIGRKAVEENKEEIQREIDGADMVFIAAGMGGGTGTGAAPIVASIAKQSGALTVAIVTKPFFFEGNKRRRVAEEGIEVLRKEVDAIIIVPNDSILQVLTEKCSRFEAFNLSNDVLRSGVRGISEIITACGEQNVDFADVRTIMANKGSAMLGIGVASGENRAEEAARGAIQNPLWEGDINGATGVLFNVVASSNFSMQELQAAANIIYESVDPEANIIFGSVTDENMGEEVRITVVATGFPEHIEEVAEGEEVFPFGSSSREEVEFPASNYSKGVRESGDTFEPLMHNRSRQF
ncbi:cell division protein FtsZ [bacterium]|nr:cell division protein FtsZ [bacterium]